MKMKFGVQGLEFGTIYPFGRGKGTKDTFEKDAIRGYLRGGRT